MNAEMKMTEKEMKIFRKDTAEKMKKIDTVEEMKKAGVISEDCRCSVYSMATVAVGTLLAIGTVIFSLITM